jgi:hypothetical protein
MAEDFFMDEEPVDTYVDDNDPLDVVANAIEDQDIDMELGEDGSIDMVVYDADGNPPDEEGLHDDDYEYEATDEEVDDLLDEHTVLQGRWKDLTKWSTQLSQTNAELRQANQDLEVRMARLEGGQGQGPGDVTEEPTLPDIDWSDPTAVNLHIAETAEKKAATIVEERMKPLEPVIAQYEIMEELAGVVQGIPDFMTYWDDIQAYYNRFPESEISYKAAYDLVKAFQPSKAAPTTQPPGQPTREEPDVEEPTPRKKPALTRQQMIDRANRLRTEQGVSGTDVGLDREPVIETIRDAINAASEEVFG